MSIALTKKAEEKVKEILSEQPEPYAGLRIQVVGGGFIEWQGYKPPDKGKPTYPFSQAKHLKKFIIDDKIPLAQLLLENEMAISGKSEKQPR